MSKIATSAPPNAPIVSPAVLTFAHVLACLNTGLTMCAGVSVAPLALPFCAPFLLHEETVVAVDGANCFNLYRLTEWAKRKRIDPLALLQRLRIARAFTPFQLATILHHMDKEMDRYRATRLVITGLPDCLYDEELTEQEARNTFARCQESLTRLADRYTVLAFSEWPLHPIHQRRRFFDALTAQAHSVFEANRTEPVSFIPLKAAGLRTLHKGDLENGPNHSDRKSDARTKPGAMDPFLPGLAP